MQELHEFVALVALAMGVLGVLIGSLLAHFGQYEAGTFYVMLGGLLLAYWRWRL